MEASMVPRAGCGRHQPVPTHGVGSVRQTSRQASAVVQPARLSNCLHRSDKCSTRSCLPAF